MDQKISWYARPPLSGQHSVYAESETPMMIASSDDARTEEINRVVSVAMPTMTALKFALINTVYSSYQNDFPTRQAGICCIIRNSATEVEAILEFVQ